jgi:hypothetical protein
MVDLPADTWVKSADIQNQRAWLAAEKMETRSTGAWPKKNLLPCADARHQKNLHSFLSLPCTEFKIPATLPLQADIPISPGSLSKQVVDHTLSPNTTSSPFFLLSLSLISPSSLLILSSHLFAHLGSSSVSSVSLSAGTAFLARSGHPWSHSACVPRRHRSEKSSKKVASREIGGVQQQSRPSFSSPTSVVKHGRTRRGSRGAVRHVVVAYSTQGGGRRRGAEQGCALRCSSAPTHELLHGGRAWSHGSGGSAQRQWCSGMESCLQQQRQAPLPRPR